MLPSLISIFYDEMKQIAHSGEVPFWHGIRYLIGGFSEVKIPERGSPRLGEDSIYYGFVCNKCYRYIDLVPLRLDCPFCQEAHTWEFGWTQSFKGTKRQVPITHLHKLLFYSCIKCKGEIKMFACPHCLSEISLFEYYHPQIVADQRARKMRLEDE